MTDQVIDIIHGFRELLKKLDEDAIGEVCLEMLRDSAPPVRSA